MINSHSELRAVSRVLDLERPLQTVEDRLSALADALQHQDADTLDRVAAELQAALSAAVADFTLAARTGGVPPVLRQRLAVAGGQVAAQREALARATASLDRAIDVLIPRMASAGLYSAAGSTDRGAAPGGGLLA
jgi:hypothetical protein